MSEKKKINWKELAVVTSLVIFVSVITFLGTWWVMDKQFTENQEASDQVRSNLMTRLTQYQAKVHALEESKEATQIYKGIGYSVKYPNTWVYRVYNGSTNSLVAFASTTSNLPAENSDQQPGIAISTATTAAVAKDLTMDTAKATKETVTIGNNVSATKWTLAAGRPNDLIGGEQKVVYYEVKLKDGTYVRLQNVADANVAVFNQILKSFTLS
jgi:flagellar capping protein FliD